jgi:hypothetical protein
MASRAFIAGDIGPGLGVEKRHWFRTRTIYRLVTVRVNGQRGFGRLRNISDGGICLETPVPVSRYDRVEIYFTNRMSLKGRIAWSVAGDCGIEFDAPVRCRDLLSEATQQCLKSGGVPLSLRVSLPVVLSTDLGEIETNAREVTPLCFRLRSRPELPAGRSGTIRMPSGAHRRGVVSRADGDDCIFLLCTPFSPSELGTFSGAHCPDNTN